MKTLHSRLRGHWGALSASEQTTLKRASWVLLPLLVYAVLWQPVHGALPRLQHSLPLLRAQAAQMQTQAAQAQTLRLQPQIAVPDSNALKLLVEKSAAAANLTLLVVAGDTNSVRVSADSLPFAQWLQWQRTLELSQHVRVTSAMLAATPQAGMVKLQATLSSGAAP